MYKWRVISDVSAIMLEEDKKMNENDGLMLDSHKIAKTAPLRIFFSFFQGRDKSLRKILYLDALFEKIFTNMSGVCQG